MLLVVEASGYHFLSEDGNVGWGVQAPVFVGPHLTRYGYTSLHLIHYKRDVSLKRTMRTLVVSNAHNHKKEVVKYSSQVKYCTVSIIK